jgi:hypothetical protein
MFVERACHVVATCEFQIDCCAAQFGSTSLHGSNQRASYTVATLISGNTQIAQPNALLARVRFKSTVKQSKTHYAISILGNKALEPSVGAEATI